MNDDDLIFVKTNMKICGRDFNEFDVVYIMFDNCFQIIDEFGNISNFHKILTFIKKDMEFAYYRKRLRKVVFDIGK